MRRAYRGAWRGVGLLLLVGAGCKAHSSAAPVPAATSTVTLDSSAISVATANPAATFATDLAPASSPLRSVESTPEAAPESGLYYERLTLGGAANDAALPWIVAFHGLGDSPRGFAQLFEGLPIRAHVYLAQAPIRYGSGYDWFGERVTGDPERLALAIQRRLEDVKTLLDALAQQPQNRGDAVVTGFSQGGVLSFGVAAAGLRHVRAALPVAGWLPASLASAGPSLPVYAFHGEEDRVVPFAETQRLLTSWHQSNGTVEYRTFPGVAHTISAEMHRAWVARLDALMR